MNYRYKPSNVCAREMNFRIENGQIEDINIIGGCPGNLMGITQLVKGMKVEEVIEKFEGITCGQKSTSCPDQLAQILRHHMKNQKASA
jgi:uncharacterized protein (TIGR03905 family)